MAVFKSSTFSEIRGSVNGMTFSRNAAGAYVRNKTIPVNPSTLLQNVARGAFQQASERWKTLSLAQRALFENHAATLTRYNKVGDEINARGQTLFVGWDAFQRYLQQRGYVTNYTIPTTTIPWGDPSPLDVYTEIPTTPDVGIHLTFHNSSLNDDARVLIQVFGPLSATRNYWRGPYIPALETYLDIASGADEDYALDGLTAGDRYAYKVSAALDDGRLFGKRYTIHSAIAGV